LTTGLAIVVSAFILMADGSRSDLGLLPLVITKITPLAPLSPYKAVVDLSFNTDMLFISFGIRPFKFSRSTPSTMYNGAGLGL